MKLNSNSSIRFGIPKSEDCLPQVIYVYIDVRIFLGGYEELRSFVEKLQAE
jgi:hypothetical protein